MTVQGANEPQRAVSSRTTAVATLTVDQPPAYDRAAELAEVYRAILPEFDDMGVSRAPSRQAFQQRAHSQASQRPDAARQAPRASAWAHSIFAPSAASSTTAVEHESDRRGSGTAQPSPSPVPAIPPRSPIRASRPPAASTPPRRPRSASQSESRASSRGPLPPSRLGRRESNSLSLQICAQLLAGELTRALAPRRGHAPEEHRAAKLQVLLLIESYEGVLESCWREVVGNESGGGGDGGDGTGEHGDESEDERMAHVREAMGILEHWLDVLYGVYEETFGAEERDVAELI